MEKPKIAILSIRNNYNFGGVFAYLHKIYNFCEEYFDPTVFYLSFDPNISTSFKKLKFKNDIRNSEFLGMKSVEIGAKLAFWEPGHYKYNLPLWEKVLADYDYFILVSGTSIAAYPLIQLNKKFVAVVAAAYKDDRAQRVKQLSIFRRVIDFCAQFNMKKIEKEIYQKAGYIFPISKDTKKHIDQIIGFKKDNLSICGFPMIVKTMSKVLSENKNIIAVGRFADPRKNFDMLMRAFKNIYEKDSSLKLYLVGNLPNKKQLLKFSTQNFYKNIIFTGNLSESELEQFYENSDLMLITSYQEGLGLIGLEAMAYGIPVIATDCGGTSDYIINGKNGFIVDIDNDKNMAEKALYILSSAEIYKNFSSYAISFVKDNYTEKKFDSIIKYGLITVYPELKDLLDDNIKKFDSKIIDNKLQEVNL